MTAVVALARLFVRLGSLFTMLPLASLSCTEAVLVMAVVPIATVSLIVAVAPATIPPRLQLRMLPVRTQTPWVVVNDWNVPGMVSERVTSAAFPGPPLVTTMLKFTNAPAFTEAGAVMVIARSFTLGTKGVTALDGSDSVLLPVALVAWTVKL